MEAHVQLTPLTTSLVRLKLACIFWGTKDVNTWAPESFRVHTPIAADPAYAKAWNDAHPEIVCVKSGPLPTELAKAGIRGPQ